MKHIRVKYVVREGAAFLAALLLSGAMLVGLGGVALAEGHDCDSNAVIKCGFSSKSDLKSKYQANQGGNVQALYKSYGMDSASDVDSMVPGYVTTDNRVYINDGGNGQPRLVATDALSSGRQNIGNSQPIMNGQFYERPPSTSFAQDKLTALVKMSNGQFQYAVLYSCGNPVRGKPTPPPIKKPQPTPGYSIEKEVSKDSQNDWQQSVKVQPNDKVQFRIIVKNIGETDFDQVMVRDVLSSGLSIVNDTLTVGNISNNGDITNVVDIGKLAHGQQAVIVFTAIASSSQTNNACSEGLVNTAYMQPNKLPEKSAQATVYVCKPAPKPTPSPAKPTPPLPNTGPGLSAVVGAVAAIIGFTAAYQVYTRVKYAA